MLVSKDDCILLVIDVQECLNPVMMHSREVIKYSLNLIRIAKTLDIPFIVTEQAPEKLGNAIIDIRQEAEESNIVSKNSFCVTENDDFMQKLTDSTKKQVIITGIELHICVLQSAVELKKLGFDVFVVIDACSSRKKLDFDAACNRMIADGINMISYEMAVFEWLKTSDNHNFKEISANFIDRN